MEDAKSLKTIRGFRINVGPRRRITLTFYLSIDFLQIVIRCLMAVSESIVRVANMRFRSLQRFDWGLSLRKRAQSGPDFQMLFGNPAARTIESNF